MDISGREFSLRRRALLAAIAMVLAAAIWLPTLHLFFRPAAAAIRSDTGLPPLATELAARQLALWEDPARRAGEIARMRATNAEWDFMGRTYLVLAFCEMSLREPESRTRYMAVAEQIIDETLRLEEEKGMYFFLMDYARLGPYLGKSGRSIFLDGEIALMLAAHQEAAPSPRYAPLLAARIDGVIDQMQAGPVLCAESYPDECWMFCNTLAVAAVKISDHVDGRSHSAFIRDWLAGIRKNLIDPQSGMLVSSFRYGGIPMDGPEGSSVWMIAHCLKLVDPSFARQQYDLARQQIAREILGFGYAREWPATWTGPEDVDSGPIVPLVGASAGSSGLAILGAASFGDETYLRELLTSLNFAAFPMRKDDELRYAASNQVGDAVLLYSLVQGPLWKRIEEVHP